MRKRRASSAALAARRAALGILLGGPLGLPTGILSASELAPVLRVAEPSPELGTLGQQPTGAAPGTKPSSVPQPTPVAVVPAADALPNALTEADGSPADAEKMWLASGQTGWIAREAIGQQIPLTDPVPKRRVDEVVPAEPTKPTAESTELPADRQGAAKAAIETARETARETGRETGRETASETSAGPGTATAPRSAVAAEKPLAVPDAEETPSEEGAAEGVLSLDTLSPVPLMKLDAPATSEELTDSEEVTERAAERADAAVPAESAATETAPEAEVLERAEPRDPATEAGASRWSRLQRDLPLRRPAIEIANRDGGASEDAAAAGASVDRPVAIERLAADREAAEKTEPDAVKPRREVRIAPWDAARQREESSRGQDDAPREPTSRQQKSETDQVAPVISAATMRLKRPIEQVLQYYYRRPEKAGGRSAWGILHSIMVYGVDTPIVSGRQRFNAISWLAGNNVCRGQRLLTVDRHGIAPRQGVGLQGHQGQLLAVLGLVGVPQDYPLHAKGRKFTVADLIAHEQRECRRGEELTFTLIALAHYLDTDAEWQSKDGERWDFERLLQEELAQPVVGAACGGTHRLMGLSHALRIRKEEGLPISGQWARAETFINDFTEYAWKLQNRDGSMSTEWFEGRGDNRDLDRKIQTTGHIVEWMLCHTPDEQLQDERLVRAVRFLASTMSRHPSSEKAIGPKGHALRSLALYAQRVFKDPRPWDPQRETQEGRAQQTRRGPAYR